MRRSNKIREVKIAKALHLYMLSYPQRVVTDKFGFERRYYLTYKEFAKTLDVSWRTLYMWVKTGKIADYYLKMLLDKKVLSKEDIE